MRKVFLLIIFLFFGLCSTWNAKAASISLLSPKSIIPGESVVTINGSGFGDSQGGKYIYTSDPYTFGDTYIREFELWSDNKIQFSAPSKLKAGRFNIILVPKVDGAGGSEIQTEYYGIQPEIKSISAATAIVGDEIKLITTHIMDIFPDCNIFYNDCLDKVQTSVYVNGLQAQLKSKPEPYDGSGSGIKAIIPQGATTGKIKVVFYYPKHDLTAIVESSSDITILQPTAQDDLSAYQQYLQQTKVDKAWDYSHGSSDVVVAVIDDGIYTGHPDLDQNMWVNSKEVEGNGKDDDNNGFIDDKWGWDFISNSKNMTTMGTHGTMVAGIIGAESNNDTGISGINWNVKLMPIIACSDAGCRDEAIKKGIRYAVDNGADIINLSLGGGVFNYTDNYNEVIKYAFDKNVLVIVAAGNGDLEGGVGRNLDITKVSPVCNDGDQNMVLGVGAVDANSQLTPWSNYGGCADIYAPGKNIISTAVPAHSTLKGFYDSADGTSFSAPIVSGIAALIKAKYPTIKNTAIQDRIINNSDYQNSRKIINAYKAISQSFNDNEKNRNNIPTSTSTPQNINNTTDTVNNIVAEEKKLITKIDNSLSKRMNGNILLQVEKNGEGWYVYPDDKKKYYLGRPADAFSIMRNLGLGIKHSELAGYLNTKFPSRLSGKIVLDVEKNGEAYYINPKDLKGYFLSRPADAFKVMRDLGLGITNTDIRKIGVGEIK